MSRSFVGLLAPALAASLLAACGDDDASDCRDLVCGACAPPLVLRVTRASGAPPANVVVEGAPLTCFDATAVEVVCTADELALGTHTLTVRADDEEPVSIVIELEPGGGGCCSCGYQPITRSVVLGASPDAGAS